MTTTWRVIIGFLVAPGLPALISYAAIRFFYPYWEAVWGATILAVFGYLGALMIGFPAHLFLNQRAVKSLWAHVISGVFIGLICYALYFVLALVILNSDQNTKQLIDLVKQNAGLAIPAMVSGALAGFVFWLIAIRP
jgi:hypothetical protein